MNSDSIQPGTRWRLIGTAYTVRVVARHETESWFSPGLRTLCTVVYRYEGIDRHLHEEYWVQWLEMFQPDCPLLAWSGQTP